MKSLFTLVLALVFTTGAMAIDNAKIQKNAKAHCEKFTQRLVLDKNQSEKMYTMLVEYLTEEAAILESNKSQAEKDRKINALKHEKEQLVFKFLSEEQIGKWRQLKKEMSQGR